MKKLIIKVKTLHERDEEIHTAMMDNLIFSSFKNEKKLKYFVDWYTGEKSWVESSCELFSTQRAVRFVYIWITLTENFHSFE